MNKLSSFENFQKYIFPNGMSPILGDFEFENFHESILSKNK